MELPKIINNLSERVIDHLQSKLSRGSRLSIAAASFSIYAYEVLKQELEQVDELRFIFTSPTFIKDQVKREKREFFIPKLHRERNLYGSDFEVKLRNKLEQKAIAKECADWIRRKVHFKSNASQEAMGGFLHVQNEAPCSYLNKEYLLPPGMGRTEAINKRIKETGITRKIRDDQAKFLAFLCSSDRETMLKIYNEGRWQAWVDANISFMQKTFGKENVVGCAGHMDEVTFHLHFTVVPILTGQAAERPDTKKQYEKRNGKEKRRYKKQEVTARLCAKDVFTPANAEQWQTEYALHMQAAGFDLQRGEVGSQAKHMDPAVYNAIKAEEAKLIAEKDGLVMQKEVLEDEVDTLQSEKDALALEVESLNKQKKQAETAVKSLQTMCSNLTIQKTQLTSDLADLQSQLSEGKISLAEYNQKKADMDKQISDCDVRLADKQQKLETKQAELKTITEKVNYYDVAYVRFDVPEIKVKPPKITERPPRFGNIDEWTKAQNASIREQFQGSLTSYGKTIMDAAQKNIIGERKFRLMQQRDMEELGDNLRAEKYHRSQQTSDTLNLLALFEKPDTAKLVRVVAIALMGGNYVSIPCAGGGSVSSETGWDGRKKDEEDENFRLRCWLHAAKTVKASQNVQTKRKGYGMK